MDRTSPHVLSTHRVSCSHQILRGLCCFHVVMMAQSGEKRDASFFFWRQNWKNFLLGENCGGWSVKTMVAASPSRKLEIQCGVLKRYPRFFVDECATKKPGKNVERYIRLSKGVYRDEGANTTGNTRSTISAMGKYIFFLLVVIHGLVGGASIHRCVLIAKSAGRNGENGIGLV